MTQSTIPDSVKPLLEAYLNHVQTELPGFAAALYLHGSIALDAFDIRHSDIDFIMIISRPCTADDLQHLKQIHQAVAREYPRWMLEGSYIQWSDLGKLEADIAPHPHWHDGTFDAAQTNDINAVTWWLLKTSGITLLGPQPAELDFSIAWEQVVVYMHQNLNTYWASWTKSPDKIVRLLTDSGIEWAVLSILRLYYSLIEHTITSKVGAGEYGLTHLPERWHCLIREALNIRNEVHGSIYRSRITRTIEAVAFLKYVIQSCNSLPLS